MLQKNTYFSSPEYGASCFVLDFEINSNSGFVLFEKQGKKILIARPSEYFSNWKHCHHEKFISLSN